MLKQTLYIVSPTGASTQAALPKQTADRPLADPQRQSPAPVAQLRVLQTSQQAIHTKPELACKQDQLPCSSQALQQASQASPAESLQLFGQPKPVLQPAKPPQQANTIQARFPSYLSKSQTGMCSSVAQVAALRIVPASQVPVNGVCGKSSVDSGPQAPAELSKATPVCSSTQAVITSTAPAPGAVAAIPASTLPNGAGKQAVSCSPKHAPLPHSSSQLPPSQMEVDAVKKEHPGSQPEHPNAKPVQQCTPATASGILESDQAPGGASTVAGSAQQPATNPTSVAQAPAYVPGTVASASPSPGIQGAAALDSAATSSDDTSQPVTDPEVLPAEPAQAQSSFQDETAEQAPVLAAEALPGRVKRLPGSSALEVSSPRSHNRSQVRDVGGGMYCIVVELCDTAFPFQISHQHKAWQGQQTGSFQYHCT